MDKIYKINESINNEQKNKNKISYIYTNLYNIQRYNI